MPMRLLRAATLASVLPFATVHGQGTLADYQRADSISARLNPLFVGMPSSPEWLGATSRFWYRTSVAQLGPVQVAQAQANQPTFRVVQILSAHSLRLVQRLLYYADLSHRQLPI